MNMLKLAAPCEPLLGQSFTLGRRFMATKQPPIRFTMDQAGLATELYIPPRTLPSWFTSPKLRWTALKRKLQVFGVNTWMAIKLRREVGRDRFQPLEWKELALVLYTRTNECFARRDLAGLSRLTSRWVYGPLSMRAKELPSDYRFDWQLVKLLNRPKVLSLVPLSMSDEPTRFVQVVYRIESRQAMTKLKVGSSEVDRQVKDVVDNVAFIINVEKNPIDGRLIGSLFDTPVTAPMPDPSLTPNARAEIMKGMSIRGDIFRPEPEYVAIRERH